MPGQLWPLPTSGRLLLLGSPSQSDLLLQMCQTESCIPKSFPFSVSFPHFSTLRWMDGRERWEPLHLFGRVGYSWIHRRAVTSVSDNKEVLALLHRLVSLCGGRFVTGLNICQCTFHKRALWRPAVCFVRLWHSRWANNSSDSRGDARFQPRKIYDFPVWDAPQP